MHTPLGIVTCLVRLLQRASHYSLPHACALACCVLRLWRLGALLAVWVRSLISHAPCLSSMQWTRTRPWLLYLVSCICPCTSSRAPGASLSLLARLTPLEASCALLLILPGYVCACMVAMHWRVPHYRGHGCFACPLGMPPEPPCDVLPRHAWVLLPCLALWLCPGMRTAGPWVLCLPAEHAP